MELLCRIILSAIVVKNVDSLWCFQCSASGGADRQCPKPKETIKSWRENITKYSNTDLSGYSCALGYDNVKITYYQAIMSNEQCQDSGLLLPIKLRINEVSPHKNAAILCCAQDGCNWNYTTTYFNYSYDKILSLEPNEANNTSILTSGFGDGYVALIILLLLALLILFCICCLFGFKKKKNQDEDTNSGQGLKPPSADSLEDIPVTPVRNINHVNVQKYSRDHERYSAVDKKLYKRELEPYKGLSDYKYHTSETDGSSGYNSAYSGADPITAYGSSKNKGRIAAVSKSVFDTEDYHKANNTVNPANEELRGGAKNWSNVWKIATSAEPSRNRVKNSREVDNYANPFRFNSS